MKTIKEIKTGRIVRKSDGIAENLVRLGGFKYVPKHTYKHQVNIDKKTKNAETKNKKNNRGENVN